jgi:hypothetical protein
VGLVLRLSAQLMPSDAHHLHPPPPSLLSATSQQTLPLLKFACPLNTVLPLFLTLKPVLLPNAPRYLNERLVYGMAPDEIADVMTQRLRWAMGALQILMKDNPLRLVRFTHTPASLLLAASCLLLAAMLDRQRKPQRLSACASGQSWYIASCEGQCRFVFS